MARGDVEQRVARLDEVGGDAAAQRAERGERVDRRRERSRRADRGQREARQRQQTRSGVLCAALAASVLAAGCAFWRAPEPPPPADLPKLDAITTLPEAPTCPRIAAIEVRKAERLLVARCDPGPEIVMKAALGRDPVGTKRSQGDRRTPEGSYRVSGPAEPSDRFHRFIPIDYPSSRDADEALSRGVIGPAAHARIVARHERRQMPPQDTALGGELGLHGEGPRWQGSTAHLDWTFGCVAVRDHEIDFLAERVERGTWVWIHP
jgi:hypothetical protein